MHQKINDYRVFPRIFLICFMLATGSSIQWYLSFPIDYIVKCNDTLLLGMLDRGVSIKEAEEVSCKTTEVLGRPLGYTALVSTLVGSSGLVFSFYTSSGNSSRRREEGQGASKNT
jgi:hypothetical protein